jgi:hypothetical protein
MSPEIPARAIGQIAIDDVPGGQLEVAPFDGDATLGRALARLAAPRPPAAVPEPNPVLSRGTSDAGAWRFASRFMDRLSGRWGDETALSADLDRLMGELAKAADQIHRQIAIDQARS